MSDNAPLVSIGLPVYNGEKYLHKALESLLAQDYENLELIISDNASTDGTAQICLDYAARDHRIRYEPSPQHLNVLANFNRAFELSSGSYFMWAAHDDYWDSSFVSCLVQKLENKPKAVLAFPRFVLLSEDGKKLSVSPQNWGGIFARGRFRQFAYLIMAESRKSKKALLIYGLIRRDALRACGGLARTRTGHSAEDILTLLRLLGQGEFVFAEGPFFYYRIRAPRTRQNQSFWSYISQRLVPESPGHRGNLISYLMSNHYHHYNLRRIIMREVPLPLFHRTLLYLGAFIREIVMPIKIISSKLMRSL